MTGAASATLSLLLLTARLAQPSAYVELASLNYAQPPHIPALTAEGFKVYVGVGVGIVLTPPCVFCMDNH
jgi:hypothetical protein